MEYVAIAILAALLVLLVARTWVRSRRHTAQLVAIAARLETETDTAEPMRDVDAALARLARAAAASRTHTQAQIADRRRFREAFDRLDAGVVVADDTGAIVYANPVAKRYLGARRVYAVVDRQIRDDIRQVISGSEPSERELDLIGPPRRLLSLRVWPLDDGEHTIGACAFVFDRTQARRVDEIRRDFVANISHELKTPVAALALLAETLSETLDDPDVTERFAKRLIDESNRLVRIIDDLIDLSRIETQEAPIREPVALDAVVSGAVERVKLDMADLDPEVSIETEPNIALVGDRRQLSTAMYNLVQNAVKYSPVGSPVRITSSALGDEVTIEVHDSGIGIPRRDLDRIFERFYRVDRARSRQTGGTGLGLAIVRHVATNHHGRVRVESEEGVGSTFALTLPIAHDAIADPEPLRSEQLDIDSDNVADPRYAGTDSDTSGRVNK